MPDYPASVLLAAEAAIEAAATESGDCGEVYGQLREFAKAALDAAVPLLAEAWGAFECQPAAKTEVEWGIRHAHGLRELGAGVEAKKLAGLLVHDYEKSSGNAELIQRTVTYGPWQEVPDGH